MIALYCSIIVVKHAITTLISETMYFDNVLLKTNRFIMHEQNKHYINKYILIRVYPLKNITKYIKQKWIKIQSN